MMLCDLGYPNELKLKVQKQGQLVHKLHGYLKTLCNKLRFLESHIRAKHRYHFPILAAYRKLPCNFYGNELKAPIKVC